MATASKSFIRTDRSTNQSINLYMALPYAYNKRQHVPSGDSWTDSGYATYVSRPRCGNSDCMRTCQTCNQLASPSSGKSQSNFLVWSPPFGDVGNGYIDPALLSTSGSKGILQSTERTNELLDWQ